MEYAELNSYFGSSSYSGLYNGSNYEDQELIEPNDTKLKGRPIGFLFFERRGLGISRRLSSGTCGT